VSEEIMRALGRVEGTLDAMKSQLNGQDEKLGAIDGRLRHVEMKAAGYGTAAGAMAGIGIALIKQKLGLGS
jgi:hypothetical protein